MPQHVNHHHHPAHEARNADSGVATEVSVVYVTAAPTFAGPIATYLTPTLPAPTSAGIPNFFDGGASSAVQSAPLAAGTQGSSVLGLQASANTASSPMIMAPASSNSVLPSNIQSAGSSIPTLEHTTLASSVAATSAHPTNANAQGAPTAAQTPVQSNSGGGLSVGARAGLAIGLLLLFAILGGIAFLFYRKKVSMDAQKHRLDDEKTNTGAPLNRAPSVAMPNPTAPRLSLKPSNEALPQMNEKQAALGGVPPVAAPTTRGRTPEPQSEADKTNPFGDDAKLAEPADAALAPKPLNISRPGTPTQGERTAAPAPAVAPGSQAAGAAAKNGPNGPLNVHRVQLDFAPSMDDELELRQGQLVRMLHEYDDGWCLCVRLDRSQQGVCPRSCISKLAVKPRPPPGQRPKGPPPPGGPRARSNSNAPSNGSRPGTPSQGPFGEGQYRADEQRKQSPTYEASLLSNSPNQSPPSSPESKQAPIARKPNPGQAV